MKKENKKVNIIPPAQVALFTGMAGLLINTIIEAADHNRQVESSRNMTLAPDQTVFRGRKNRGKDKTVEPERVDEAARQYVVDRYPYLVSEANENCRYYLTQSVNIGRYPHNDIRVDDETVSRVHCRIFLENDSCYLIDMGATTPAKINGKSVESISKLASGDVYRARLRDGDVITIGRSVYRFCDPAVSAPAAASRDFMGTVVL